MCSNERVSRPASDLAASGRTQLVGVLGVMFVLVLAPVLVEWVRRDFDRWPWQLLSATLTLLLFRRVLDGARWARQVTVAMAFLGGAIAALLGVLFTGATALGYAVFVVGLVFILCGFAIISSPAIDAYLTGVARRRP